MRRIVLPLVAALDVGSITTLNICIAIEVVIPVDVDVVAAPAATPTPTAAPRGSHRQSHTKRDRARSDYATSRVRWVINWRIWICGRSVYNRRVVRRHIDDFRIRLFYYNDLFILNRLGLNIHLLIVLQRSSPLSLSSHALNRIHDVALLRQEGVAQIGGPLNVIGQEFDDIRQSRHRLDTWIPGLLLDFCR
jgi:hypothetical protein